MPYRAFWISLALIYFGMLWLRISGQPWWCACGDLALWNGDVWSRHCSQHLFDPYSFSHILHGGLFYPLLLRLFGSKRSDLRWIAVVILELGWEVLENSPIIIDRYRSGTMALDYVGDSVINSLGDLGSCLFGYYLTSRLSVRSVVLVALTLECGMLYAIRDNLTLNIIMLVWPVEAIKGWQMGSH